MMSKRIHAIQAIRWIFFDIGSTLVDEEEAYLETETDKTENLQRFIDKVKKLTEIKELTPELIHEFIDRIVVYAPKYLDGKRYQVVDVYYSGVGILRELSPEEMEEAFQKRLAKQVQGKEIPA